VALTEELQALARDAMRASRRFAVMLMDLDRFNVINDSLGHAAGDLLLKEVAERLSLCMRGDDLIARYAGDEFVMLVRELPDPEALNLVAERMMHERCAEQLAIRAELPFALDPGEIDRAFVQGLPADASDNDVSTDFDGSAWASAHFAFAPVQIQRR
jgi:GGDEF domain-containing protein